MPYADSAQQALPYASGSDTSHAAAQAVASSAHTQRAIMAGHYQRYRSTGLTDHEMHDVTGYPINVINARRNELRARKIGVRMGPCGVRVSVWTLEALTS